jgi:hypothetical protein
LHVLPGPAHFALRRGIAQAVLAVILITLAPAAGVQWVHWLMVGSSVPIVSAALLVIWPAEHGKGPREVRAPRHRDGDTHEQPHRNR